MEWFIERPTGREGPYMATEITARLSAGLIAPDTAVISTKGELRLTAGALVAASTTPADPPSIRRGDNPDWRSAWPSARPEAVAQPAVTTVSPSARIPSAGTAASGPPLGNAVQAPTPATSTLPPPMAQTVESSASALLQGTAAIPSASVANIPSSPTGPPVPKTAWMSTITPFEWSLGAVIVLAYVAPSLPLPVAVTIVPVVAGFILIAIDVFRQRIGGLALSKAPLSKLERWAPSTWIVSTGVLWGLYAPVYLFKRRRLIACVADLNRCGSYPNQHQKKFHDTQLGVSGAEQKVAHQRQTNQDFWIQIACLVVFLAAVTLYSVNSRPALTPDNVIVPVLHKIAAQIDDNASPADVVSRLHSIDVSDCPSDFRKSFSEYIVAWVLIAQFAEGRKTVEEGNGAADAKEFALMVNDFAVKSAIERRKDAQSKMLAIAASHGVSFK